jgi:hypothetical protein
VKTETFAHQTERVKRATEPVYILRFYHVPDYGKATSYPFSRDFTSAPIREATKPALMCLERLGGGPAQIVPEQGRASIGGFQVDAVDMSGEILHYFANLQLTLSDAITASSPGPGGSLRLNDVGGLPAMGTVEVNLDPEIERIRYSAKDEATNTVIVSARGVDGTTARAHPGGTTATNGEQIRPGQRVELLSGYASMPESLFMQSQLVEVIDRSISDVVRASYTIETADITRALRREVFLTATQDAPFIIGGHPLTIALQILTSTGQGTNGPYDVLPEEDGIGIPQAFVDVAGIEALREDFPFDGYCFTITGPQIAKTWLEQEIFKTINGYPLVRQDGTLTVKLYTPVLT